MFLLRFLTSCRRRLLNHGRGLPKPERLRTLRLNFARFLRPRNARREHGQNSYEEEARHWSGLLRESD
jgi:hypothetical protein